MLPSPLILSVKRYDASSKLEKRRGSSLVNERATNSSSLKPGARDPKHSVSGQNRRFTAKLYVRDGLGGIEKASSKKFNLRDAEGGGDNEGVSHIDKQPAPDLFGEGCTHVFPQHVRWSGGAGDSHSMLTTEAREPTQPGFKVGQSDKLLPRAAPLAEALTVVVLVSQEYNSIANVRINQAKCGGRTETGSQVVILLA